MNKRECPLLAQSRHALVHCKCPLLGVKRTLTNRCSSSRIELCADVSLIELQLAKCQPEVAHDFRR